MQYIAAGLLATAGLAAAGCPRNCYVPSETSSLQLSCHNTTTAPDTCCFNSPGGYLLQTQFWDYDPSSGPANSWTVHGLWPDNCDGTYDQYCDESRQYKNITQILESYGETSLLSYMKTYWTDYHGAEESFWEHEWGKHGTCMSTLDTRCYSNYSPQEEVVDFFKRTVDLFKTLPSYQFLAAAGITPSTSRNYTFAAVEAALSAGHANKSVTVLCDDSGALEQIYYYYNTIGSVPSGLFVPADSDGAKSNCPASVRYPPKQTDTAYPVSSVTGSAMPTKTLQTGPTCRPNGI